MNNSENITLGVLSEMLGTAPALVIGEDATLPPTFWENLRQNFDQYIRQSEIRNDASGLGGIFNSVVESGVLSEDEIRIKFNEFIANFTPATHINHLAKVRWSAIVSLTRDCSLEHALELKMDSTPSSKSLLTIRRTGITFRPRTLPLFKLLGDPRTQDQRERVAISDTDVLLRQTIWPQLIREIPDSVKGGSMVFLGCRNNEDLVMKFLASLFSLSQPYPSNLVFLESEYNRGNREIERLVSLLGKKILVNATVSEVCNAIEGSQTRQMSLPFYGVAGKPLLIPEYLKSLVSNVPSEALSSDYIKREKQVLKDSLFRPTDIDWRPYQADLDFRRSATDSILSILQARIDAVSKLRTNELVLVTGSAGVGKTTVLKRTAVDLTRLGYFVVWLRTNHHNSWSSSLKKILSAVKASIDETSKIVFFVDNPISLHISIYELIQTLESESLNVIIVISVRPSDYVNSDFDPILPKVPLDEIEVSEDLDDDEYARLPDYLVKLGVSETKERAISMAAGIPAKNSKDILCSFWFLLPETRGQLSASLQDEYFRLGGSNELVEAFANEANSLGQSAKRAYELVAVASSMQLGVPVEVLVRSLEVSYEEWGELSTDGKTLWGILYAERDEERETILYRTRNVVVTNVLNGLISRGHGVSGNYTLLKQLVGACSVGLPMYRDFLIELLVGSRKTLGNMLTLEQGIELYDIAEAVFPSPERLIAHHKGLWMRDKGGNLQDAHGQLEKALNVPNSALSPTDEPREFVYTSLAATVVKQTENGDIDSTVALDLVRQYLRKTNNPRFFDAYQNHIFASALFKVSQHADEEIKFSSVIDALKTIERGLVSIGPGVRRSKHSRAKEILRELQGKIVDSLGEIDLLIRWADELYDKTKSQIGFVLIGRKLLADAVLTDKGKDYKKVMDWINDCESKLEGDKSGIEIVALRVDLIIRWQLQGTGGGRPRWEKIEADIRLLSDHPDYSDDVIKLFYFAVAIYHQGRGSEAEALFSRLRSVTSIQYQPKRARAVYLNDEGKPKTFQGELSIANQRSYIYVTELDEQLLYFGKKTAGPGATVSCKLAFSLNGAYAISTESEDIDLLLP